MKLKTLSVKFNELDFLLRDAKKVDAVTIMPEIVELLPTEIDLLDQSLSHAFPDKSVVNGQVNNLIYLGLYKNSKMYTDYEKQAKVNYWSCVDIVNRICVTLSILAKTNHNLSQEYLPVHTNNEDWIARYLQKACYSMQKENNLNKIKAGKAPSALQEIPLVKVKKYIDYSQNFKDQFHEYQCKVVNCIVENEIDQFSQLEQFAYHRWTLPYFYSFINKKTKSIGIGKDVVRTVMGKNQQWREKLLKMTFWGPLNSLSMTEMKVLKNKYPEDYAKLALLVKEAYQIYKQQEEQKEFEYYKRCNSQKDIDALGLNIDQEKMVQSCNYLNPLRVVNNEFESCRNLLQGSELGI